MLIISNKLKKNHAFILHSIIQLLLKHVSLHVKSVTIISQSEKFVLLFCVATVTFGENNVFNR